MRAERLPTWLRIWGILTWPGAAFFVLHILWEETLVTWRHGPQDVGKYLAHTELFLPLLASTALALLWLSVVGVRTFGAWRRCDAIPTSRWLLLAGGSGLIALLLVPYGFWQRLAVRSLARGPHAVDFLNYAAASGDIETVRALLAHGVAINALNADGATALHAAAVEDQTEAISFLLESGADPLIKDHLGDTALDGARERHRRRAAQLLSAHTPTAPPQPANASAQPRVVARFIGRVVAMRIGASTLPSVRVDVDPRFAMEVVVQEILDGQLPARPGGRVAFLIHSPTKFFVANLGKQPGVVGGYFEGPFELTVIARQLGSDQQRMELQLIPVAPPAHPHVQ
jgi:hypothetical protein